MFNLKLYILFDMEAQRQLYPKHFICPEASTSQKILFYHIIYLREWLWLYMAASIWIKLSNESIISCLRFIKQKYPLIGFDLTSDTGIRQLKVRPVTRAQKLTNSQKMQYMYDFFFFLFFAFDFCRFYDCSYDYKI